MSFPISRMLAALFALVPLSVPAATFTVTRFDDPAPGACDADCSLREAIRAANQAAGTDDVVLPAGTFALSRLGNDDVADVGDLDVQGPVRITGAGATLSTIDANATGRIFHLDPEGDGNLTIEIRDLGMIDGSDNFGGAVLNLANTTLERVSIRNSIADAGGGILAQRPIVIRTSTISGNQVRTGGYGGGIWVQSSSVRLTGTTLSANTAHLGGGGMVLLASTATVEQSSLFDANVASGGGGAIVLLNASRLDAFDSNFTGNRSSDDGGALAVQGSSQVTLAGVNFTGNRAEGQDFGGGGAIFMFDGTVVATNTNFRNNVAFGEGGGAVLVAGPTLGTMTTTGGSFTGNRAEQHGGPLPASNPGLGGAVLVIAGSTYTATGTNFVDNVAALAGGAVYNDREATLTLDGSTVSSNESLTQIGGAIASEGTLTIRRSFVTGNSAPIGGGAIAASRAPILIEDSEFSGNVAPNGGALGISDGGTLTIRRSAFIGNNANGANPKGLGGAILLEPAVGETLPQATAENTTFDGNIARDGSVAVLGSAGNSSLRFVHATIANNTTGPGGVSFIATASGTITFKASIIAGTCSFTGNYVTQGRNIESPGNTCRLGGTDLPGVSAATLALGALALNGGTTRNRVPGPASPARDFVQTASCTQAAGGFLLEDQRRFVRPFGSACDAGSIEAQPVDLIFRDGFE